ncbi:MAG TPA: sialidase family protein [Nitrososphaeraceae archaeon]|nr:sialidase family protein [Nitrososphaeraceae archaeon]
MTNLSLNFRNINRILSFNILINFTCVLFIFVLGLLVFNCGIDAINESNVHNFQNIASDHLKKNKTNLNLIDYRLSNVTNLTNNNEDSIYGQVGSFEDNVYIVWEESVIESLPYHNYDIFFMKSEDNGKTFSKPLNLSNNTEFSERPQIAISKGGIFVIWTDTTNSNNTKEVMFTKSEDNGKTFSKTIRLSNHSKDSYNPEISVFNNNVYTVWQETGQNKQVNNNGSIIFRSSVDRGNTFNHAIELVNNAKNAFPKINSYKSDVYVLWNNENKKNGGIFFVKSQDKGNNFDKVIKLNENTNYGESQIAINQNEILVVWGGLLTKNIEDLYYVKSNDTGNTFTSPNTFSTKIINSDSGNNYTKLYDIVKNPLNVEVINNNHLEFLVWQNSFSNQNEDILLLMPSSSYPDQNNYARLLNLSHNPSISECPSLAISNNTVYIIWEDYINKNHEILFAKVPFIS